MTTTVRTPDDDLMELVRGADPLDGHAASVSTDAVEALLREILAVPRRDNAPARPRTRAVRVAAVGATAAVAVAGAAALIREDRGGVTPASAAVIRHAMAALDQPPGTILHVDMTGTQTNGDGTTITWRDQSWQQDTAPYSRRQIETSPQGTTTESANAGEAEQVYDAAANTIYQSTVTHAQQPRYRLASGPRAGTYTLRLPAYRVSVKHPYAVKLVYGAPGLSLVITARQARAIKDGTDTVKWVRRKVHGNHMQFRPAVVPASSASNPPDSPDPSSPDFAQQIRALLQSGGAHVVGHATVDGRDTLEISSTDGHTTYYVDPNTYAPVELNTTGTDGGTSLVFNTYEFLPDNAANEALLSLTAQHPSATVDRNQADYVAAEQRLFPNG
jgi:hypothetical protein